MTTTDRTALGIRLKKAREYRGYSQGDIAQVLKIPRSAISLIEAGTRKIDAMELTRLARFYECSVDELTEEQEHATSSSTVEMVARTAAKLSESDRAEVLRFAQFLEQRLAKDERDE